MNQQKSSYNQHREVLLTFMNMDDTTKIPTDKNNQDDKQRSIEYVNVDF